MVRYEKTRGPINVAWGYDEPLKGYFLTVTDYRLEWKEGATAEVNDIASKVGTSGEGNYFELNTYPVGGFGFKVSEETIFTYMRRYGINPDKIFTNDAVSIDEDIKICRNIQNCKVRETANNLRCSRCKYAWYCSKECQVADWKSHKAECDEVFQFRSKQEQLMKKK
ncbi:hypothetical protein BGW41_003117 [Actinomortierella wolfii]|nr:hypothetical protein BGW41_003117 [Actinomortierella wolfii]